MPARDRPPRDARQVRVFTLDSARWMIRHRAWSRFYLVRYWRYALLRLRHPEVVTEGFVFLGRRVVVEARPGYGRVVLGRWVHLGDGTQVRAHEGTLRIGDKCVFGRENTVNCYLDVEIGARTLVADWVHVTDFDHRFDDIHRPVKDQGIVKTPVRIGPDCWLGVKSTVLRGSVIGRGTVVAAHAVVRGVVPELSVVGRVPARVLKDRRAAYEADAARREALADIARKTARAAAAGPGPAAGPLEAAATAEGAAPAERGRAEGFEPAESAGPAEGAEPAASAGPAEGAGPAESAANRARGAVVRGRSSLPTRGDAPGDV